MLIPEARYNKCNRMSGQYPLSQYLLLYIVKLIYIVFDMCLPNPM